MDTIDVVIVGSGINSLVCAAMLVRKGKRVCVLERNAVAGGCIRTGEVTVPGFRHDLFSMSYPLFVMSPHYPLRKDGLEAGGLKFVSGGMPTGVVLPDGRSLVFSQSRDENVATLNAVSPGDGDAYRAAMAVHAAVAPAVNARWMLQELPRPVPGPNQVLIRIHASGICCTDVHQTHGHLPGAFPRILGHEPVGEIVELGPGVVTRKVGDRVGVPWVQTTDGRCEWCLRGRLMFCPNAISTGTQAQGGHAEFMPAYASATMLIPDNVSYEQAAPIFCAGYTVWSGLRWADPKPGERVAVVGIGGLGHLAVQYAKAAGFDTIAVSHSPDKDQLVRSLGADEVVRDGAGLLRAGGADIVLSTSNSTDAMVDSIQGLRPDGRLVTMGADVKPLSVSLNDLIFRRIKIIGSQQNGPEYLYEALDFVAKGRVKVIAETYKLDEINRAYDRVESGNARFRAVIVQ